MGAIEGGGVVLLGLYFLPTLIGFRHHNSGAIFTLNLLLGWTLIGWIVALVWAMTKPAPVAVPTAPPPGMRRPTPFEMLTRAALIFGGIALALLGLLLLGGLSTLLERV